MGELIVMPVATGGLARSCKQRHYGKSVSEVISHGAKKIDEKDEVHCQFTYQTRPLVIFRSRMSMQMHARCLVKMAIDPIM
jgi:hypothetical protein